MINTEYETKQANEAELSVIGALLVKPDLYVKAAGIIAADDFYYEFNKIIYGIIADLYMSTGICDLILLVDRIMAKMPNRDRAGIREYLAKASETVVILDNVEYYCRVIKNRSISRQARKMAYEAYEAGFYGPDGEPREGIQSLAEKLADLTRDKTKRSSRKLCDVLLDVHRDLFGGGKDLSIDTGFGSLDRLLDGIYPSDLIFIGAYTGVGKTAFILQIMQSMAKKGKKSLLFSQEMKDTQNAIRIIARQSGVDLNKLKKPGRLDDAETVKVMEAMAELSVLPIEIKDDGGITVDDIRLEFLSKKDIDVIFIDHIGLMRLSKGEKKIKRIDEITQLAIDLRALAMQINKPVIVLSQFNRESVKTKNEPDLSCFRESGEIEQSATAAILIWQTPDYGETGIIGVKVAKNRQGSPGRLYMRFDAPKMTFTEIDYDRMPKFERKANQKEIQDIFG